GAGRLQTAVFDPLVVETPADTALAFRKMHEAGATIVRLRTNWKAIAPSKNGSDFDAADPGDPQYRWAEVDREVRAAVAAHLEPILDVYDAPDWARDAPSSGTQGPVRPDPSALAAFATAAGTRYGGGFQGLGRVR